MVLALTYLVGELLCNLGGDELQDLYALLKHERSSGSFTIQTLVHLLKRYVLETEHALRVVVRNHDAVHVPDACLEAVKKASACQPYTMRTSIPELQEGRANEIVVLALEALLETVEVADEISYMFLQAG